MHDTKREHNFQHLTNLETELVHIINRQIRVSFIGSLITAFVAVYIFRDGIENRWILYEWLGCFFMLTLVRFLFFTYIHQPGSPKFSAIRWMHEFVFLAFCSGILWGWLSYWIILFSSSNQMIAIIFFAAGLTASALASYIVSFHTVAAFCVPFLASIIIASLIQGDKLHTSISVMSIIYLVVLLVIAKRLNNSVIFAVQQQFDKMNLIKEMEKAKREAEDASVGKSRFLATVSHELRTPLNTIMMASKNLKRKTLSPESTVSVNIIQSASSDLLAIINDILEHVSLIKGHLSLKESQDSLFRLVEHLRQTYEDAVKKKGISFNLQLDPDLPDMFVVDHSRLRQILTNLLDNALKFTPQGTIGLSVKVTKDENANVQLLFIVSDTGIGINEEQLAILFEPFVQADSSMTRKYNGIGLGLSIVKDLAETMGGSVKVASIPGKETSFTLLIPFRVEEQQHMLPGFPTKFTGIPAPALSSLNILLAEDDDMNRLLLTNVLSVAGHTVHSVDNGISAALEANSGNYDLLITDLNMPLLDGLKVIRNIRDRERQTGKYIPIIVVSAHVFPEDRDNSLREKADAYLAKPIDEEDLHQVIQKVVRLRYKMVVNQVGADALTFLMHKCKNNIEVYNRTLNTFYESSAKTMERMREAVDKKDGEQLWRSAHKLKGQLLLFDQHQLVEQALHLEKAGKSDDLRECAEKYHILQSGMDMFLQSLQSSTS